ncbi:FAD-binding protein [Arsenicicoccus sp. MKL-02]|uniref:Cholesterol oxidase n=1 Tax=Arsenicicoccus cauae TaxID=2663847 RepID=A0A6I3IBP1_9MICO|nr:GMC oxidoreductase [Arsenicicoccus cauae]MTB71678.1 FAD-binding protein [Arsenicicoccus cauae]
MHTTGTPSRRAVLTAAAATAATTATAAASTTRPAYAASDATAVVIIGSGYAGAVAALRLAQAGIRSIVLERGRRWQTDGVTPVFATPDRLDGRAFWLSNTSPVVPGFVPLSTGVLEANIGAGITALAGSGVGGGSLVNNAVMMVPRRDHFTSSFGATLGYDEMATRWYPRARDLIGATPIPDDVLQSPQYANARQARTELERAGIDTVLADIAVDWERVRGEMAGRYIPSLIKGDCILGVNSGAKRSVDRTILAAAEKTGLVEVRPLSRVKALASAGASGWTVTVEKLSLAGAVTQTYALGSPKVILAAGSLGSSRLLMAARAARTAPIPSTVGTQWGTNGDTIVLLGGTVNPQPAVGGPAHVVGRRWDGLTPPVSMLNFPVGVPIVDAIARESLCTSIVPPKGYLAGFAGVYAPVWPELPGAPTPVAASVNALTTKITDANPGRTALISSSLLTSHALGGALLGKSTDQYGQVLGCSGLYVMDASLIPGSTGAVPPALTVTALADRCITKALTDGHFEGFPR